MKHPARFFLALVLCLALSLSGLLVGIPTARAAGTDTWTQLPLYGGEVLSVTVDPTDTSRVYVAIVENGVFRSTDGGDSWQASVDDGTNMYPSVLAVDPDSPVTIYAGADNHVSRSDDYGAHWRRVSTGLPDMAAVRAIAVDPSNTSRLFAATQVGLFCSDDRAANWHLLDTGFDVEDFRFVVLAPSHPSTVYLSTGKQVYRSGDSGKTWIMANGAVSIYGINCLTADPADSETVYTGTSTDGILCSSDGGVSWQSVYSSSGVGSIVFDAASPTVAYAGIGRGVLRSSDGGDHWNEVTGDASMVGRIAFASQGLLYASGIDDSGLLRSQDSGSSWTYINEGLAALDIRSMAIDPRDPTTVVAVTLMGRMLRSVDGGDHWNAVGDSTQWVSCIVRDPILPSVMYCASSQEGVLRSVDGGEHWEALGTQLAYCNVRVLTFGLGSPAALYAVTSEQGIVRSTDRGSTWEALSGQPGGYVQGMAFDPRNTSTLYTYGGQSIYRSVDEGTQWSVVADFTDATGPVTCLAFDARDTSVMYAGTWYGGLFRSLDSGQHWSSVDLGLPWPCQIALGMSSSSDSGQMYVATVANGIFRTRDYGEHWATIGDQSILGTPMCMAVSSGSFPVVYVGTTRGVFEWASHSVQVGVAGDESGGSILSANPLEVPDGGSATFLVSIASGYSASVSTGTLTDATWTIPGVTEDITATITFVPMHSYIVTSAVAPSSGGTITKSPDQSSYAPGTVVTLTAIPATGYTFIGWTGATPVSGHPDQATVTMDADKTVTATFTSSTTISGDIDGDGSVTMGDALLLAQSIVGIATLTTAQRLAADVNGDGSITMADTLLVAQIVVGIAH